jgi:hypothetical protein
MRIIITKDGQEQSVKEDKLQRFMEKGWQTIAQPIPENISTWSTRVVVEANADVLTEAVFEVKPVEDNLPTETNKEI